jgi:hypothetical protein
VRWRRSANNVCNLTHLVIAFVGPVKSATPTVSKRLPSSATSTRASPPELAPMMVPRLSSPSTLLRNVMRCRARWQRPCSIPPERQHKRHIHSCEVIASLDAVSIPRTASLITTFYPYPTLSSTVGQPVLVSETKGENTSSRPWQSVILRTH